MRVEPVHPQPQQPRTAAAGTSPAASARARVRPGGDVGAAAHGGAVNGRTMPQARVDYRAAGQIKRRVSEQLLAEAKANRALVGGAREQRARALINEAVSVWADAAGHGAQPVGTEQEQALAAVVFDMLFRAGRLQRYLDDERVQNILINGHDRVYLDYGDARLRRVEPVADSDEELRELIRDLARNSGQGERTFSTGSPLIALRLADGSRLQAMCEVTGERTYATIRRHSIRDADLGDLVRLGSLSPALKEFLAACVRAGRNVMIVGEQNSGKTSLLRALLKEIPAAERFGTLETEFELWAHKNGYHQQVVPMEARESNGERVDGRAAGEITLLDLMQRALRMSLTRIVVGEVRGPEITALMQALTNGRGGNLCTMHASEPRVVFDRIAELYLLAQGNFSEQLAYRQIANGLHVVVFLSMQEGGGRERRFVSHVWEITGVGEGGRPAYNEVFGPQSRWESSAGVPLTPPSPALLRRLERAGFDPGLLRQPRPVEVWPPEMPA
ncbi:CpaF/VirB11 family protein [Streptomyces sp. NPDC051907]|uniref:CpaF family protein n=1 Tax=Streptomyces sp. NPDC051907 TaxID=3155284 RepID=UPI00342A7E23